jgi:uncharacterized protein YggE
MVVLLTAGSTAIASPLPEYPFVFAAGSAEVDVPPDIVRLKLRVSAHHADADAALAAVQETSNRVLEILAAAGVKSPDIDASSIDKSARRHWDNTQERSVPDGFDVTRRFTVVVRNLAKYPEMGKALLALPNTDDFDPTFNRTDRTKIEADLLARAAQDARNRAEQMAAGFARSLGPVRAIAQIPFSALPHWLGFSGDEPYGMHAMVFDRRAPEVDRLLVPATISISESVNVLYELR